MGSHMDFLIVSIFENTPDLTGQGPKQPAPVGSAWTMGLDWLISRGPYQTQLSWDLVTVGGENDGTKG